MNIPSGDKESRESSPGEIDEAAEGDFGSLAPMAEAVTFARVFGEWMKRARKAKGWDQTELATRTGISQGNVSDYERAQRNLGIETIDQLIVVLGTNALAMLIGMSAVGEELEKRQSKEKRPRGHSAQNLDDNKEDSKRVIDYDPMRFRSPNEVTPAQPAPGPPAKPDEHGPRRKRSRRHPTPTPDK